MKQYNPESRLKETDSPAKLTDHALQRKPLYISLQFRPIPTNNRLLPAPTPGQLLLLKDDSPKHTCSNFSDDT